MDKSKAIAKAIEASYFKIRGKLLESKRVGTLTWQFVIWKETKNKKTKLKRSIITHFPPPTALLYQNCLLLSEIKGLGLNSRQNQCLLKNDGLPIWFATFWKTGLLMKTN